MSTKHVRTIADLSRFRCTLRITCWNNSCQRQVLLTGAQAFALLGDRPIKGLSRKLRCTGCGFKNASAQWYAPKG